jgi:GTPase SAR1 family protein
MQPKYVNILNFVYSYSAGVLVLFETHLLVSTNTSIATYFGMLLYLCYRAITYN